MLSLPAYLDAGTGSMLLQVLAGGFAAAAVAGRLFWNRILTLLRIRKPQEEPAGRDAAAPAAARNAAARDDAS